MRLIRSFFQTVVTCCFLQLVRLICRPDVKARRADRCDVMPVLRTSIVCFNHTTHDLTVVAIKCRPFGPHSSLFDSRDLASHTTFSNGLIVRRRDRLSFFTISGSKRDKEWEGSRGLCVSRLSLS